MLLSAAEIVDVKRFSTPWWKLVSYAVGLAPSIRKSSSEGKIKTGRKITKQGSPSRLRGWILVKCALTAIRFDAHLRTFYDRIRNRRGHATAIIVAITATKELLVIIGICGLETNFIDIWTSKDMNKSYTDRNKDKQKIVLPKAAYIHY